MPPRSRRIHRLLVRTRRGSSTPRRLSGPGAEVRAAHERRALGTLTEDVRLGMERPHDWHRRGPLRSPFRRRGGLDIALEIQQSHQRVRFADSQVVAGQDAQSASPVEQVSQVFEDSIQATLEHEADNDVGSVRCGQLRDDVRQQRVVTAGDQTLGEDRRSRRLRQIVPAAWNDMANAASWIWNVTVVPRDDVNVEMRNRLPSRRSDVDANVEAVRRMSSQHCFPGGGNALGQRRSLSSVASNQLATCRRVTTRACPSETANASQTPNTRSDSKNTRLGSGLAKRTGRLGHGSTLSRDPFDSERPSSPIARHSGHRHRDIRRAARLEKWHTGHM